MGKKANVDRAGQQIADRYRLEEMIGAGGMGVVYRAVHLFTGRDIAVKLLEKGATETAGRRFIREARAAAAVRHPNLVEVIDVGVDESGAMYLVLELLEGESFADHLKRKGAISVTDALDVLIPILDALEALHRVDVIHRDIKPANIHLSVDGTSRVIPKLLDLGVSKKMSAKEALTETGAVLGTPHYMSPEMAMGELEVGVPADIWAMGVVFFEALVGHRPFRSESVPGLLHKIATTRPPSLSEARPDVPLEIARIMDSALAYEAADRPRSASEFGDALVSAALDAGLVLSCRMPSGPRISLAPLMPAKPPVALAAVAHPVIEASVEAPRRRWVPLLAVALLTAGAAGIGALLHTTMDMEPEEPAPRAATPPAESLPIATAEARSPLMAGGGVEVLARPGVTNPIESDAGMAAQPSIVSLRAGGRRHVARGAAPAGGARVQLGPNESPILGSEIIEQHRNER